jgi:alpha-tubulin suppressor-like RCC1 family protein
LSVLSAGNNGVGQLGDNSNTNSIVPVQVSGGHTFVQVATKARQSCGVTQAGAALCWGGCIGVGVAGMQGRAGSIELF